MKRFRAVPLIASSVLESLSFFLRVLIYPPPSDDFVLSLLSSFTHSFLFWELFVGGFMSNVRRLVLLFSFYNTCRIFLILSIRISLSGSLVYIYLHSYSHLKWPRRALINLILPLHSYILQPFRLSTTFKFVGVFIEFGCFSFVSSIPCIVHLLLPS